MKTKELTVPVEVIIEIARVLEVNEINNTIIGTAEDEQIIIEVEYDHDQRHIISELEEIIDNYFQDEDENDEQ